MTTPRALLEADAVLCSTRKAMAQTHASMRRVADVLRRSHPNGPTPAAMASYLEGLAKCADLDIELLDEAHGLIGDALSMHGVAHQ